jgi:transcriptional regulator of acetoin/glycerol metabolism
LAHQEDRLNSTAQPAIRTLDEATKRAVEKAIRASDTMQQAAKTLGVDRRTLYRMCKRFNIEQPKRCPRCKRRMPA